MRQINRRKLLTTTAAGTGVAFGVGSASARVVSSDQTAGTSAVTSTFQAVAQEGYVAIDSDNRFGDGSSIGRVDFTGEDLGGQVEISGEINNDDTWQSTSVSFPSIDIQSLLEGVDLPVSPSDIDADVNIVVPTITGQIDRDGGFMTADISLTVDVSADILGVVSTNFQVTAETVLTSGESGELEGSTQGLDTSDATVTLVSNDFTIPGTGEVIDPPLVDAIDIDEELGLPANDPQRNYLELTLDMDISDNPGELAGTVLEEDGTPLAVATVSVVNGSTTVTTTTTDGNGNYSVELPGGSYDVVVDEDGYERFEDTVDISGGTTTNLSIILSEPNDGSVKGTVTDINGDPISGADITAELLGETVATATTDGNGQYSLTIEADKSYTILANAEGYDEQTAKVSVSQLTEKTVDFQFGEVPSPGEVFGTVNNSTDGPLGGADIAFVDPVTGETVKQTTSDSTGSYEVTVSPGEYRVVVNKEGYLAFSNSVTVTEGGQKALDIDMSIDHVIPTIIKGPPTDPDGDDLYEDVRGDGTVNIFDVQAMFQNLNNEILQEHSEYFNFQGSNPDEVTIFDVQALFNKIQE